MENHSDRLQGYLNFKSLMMPHWFDVEVEDWTMLGKVLEDFLQETFIAEVVQKLLDIENDPRYWIEAATWPHPDAKYLTGIVKLIDMQAPPHWDVNVKMFWFAWILQHMRRVACPLLQQVYEINLQKQ